MSVKEPFGSREKCSYNRYLPIQSPDQPQPPECKPLQQGFSTFSDRDPFTNIRNVRDQLLENTSHLSLYCVSVFLRECTIPRPT